MLILVWVRLNCFGNSKHWDGVAMKAFGMCPSVFTGESGV